MKPKHYILGAVLIMIAGYLGRNYIAYIALLIILGIFRL